AAGGGTDASGADAVVKGQDRAPTDVIDKLVDRLRAVVNDRRTAEQAAVTGRIWITAIVLGVVFTALVVLTVIGTRTIVRPLERVMLALDEGAGQTTSAASQ